MSKEHFTTVNSERRQFWLLILLLSKQVRRIEYAGTCINYQNDPLCLFLWRQLMIQLENLDLSAWIFLLQAVQPSHHLPQKTLKSIWLWSPELTRVSQPILYWEENCFLKPKREGLKPSAMRYKHRHYHSTKLKGLETCWGKHKLFFCIHSPVRKGTVYQQLRRRLLPSCQESLHTLTKNAPQKLDNKILKSC